MTAPGSTTLTKPDGLRVPAGGERFAPAETAVEVANNPAAAEVAAYLRSLAPEGTERSPA